jgi:hypothetical protein
MSKFGPSRGELLFRLAVSLAGLALLAAALMLRGLPEGPGFVEVVGVAGLFFGGTAVLSLRALLRRD